MREPTLTHPGRWAAWVLVRLRALPPELHGSAWRAAAHIYRDRAINTMQALRTAQADIRTLQEAFDAQDDARPLSGGELDRYVDGLRQRCSVLAMYCVDLERERDQARAEAAAWRRDWQNELDGGAELRTHLGARENETIWAAADRVVAELQAARTLADAVARHPGCLVDDGEMDVALAAYEQARKETSHGTQDGNEAHGEPRERH